MEQLKTFSTQTKYNLLVAFNNVTTLPTNPKRQKIIN